MLKKSVFLVFILHSFSIFTRDHLAIILYVIVGSFYLNNLYICWSLYGGTSARPFPK